MRFNANIEKREFLIIVSVIALIAGAYFLGPGITSFVIKQFGYSEELNLVIASSGEYVWDIKNSGVLKNARLDGSITNDGNARVYLEGNNGTRYLILNSSEINESAAPAVDLSFPSENETLFNTTEKAINLKLRYNENSDYDKNNDGKESIYGIIDLKAEPSFNWEANEENICARWEIVNQNDLTATQLCHGNSSCCAYVNLVPKRANWSEPYFASFGNDNAGNSNIISAQIIYAEFNSTGDGLYSSAILSQWKSLNVSFDNYYKEFSNICKETCLLEGLNKTSYRLVFEIEGNATLKISKIHYDIDAEIINNPPSLIRNISNITLDYSSAAEISLKDYFADSENDALEYSYYENEGMKIEFKGDTAVITPVNGFEGIVLTFIRANDSENQAISNLFSINITKPKSLLKKSIIQNKDGNAVFWIDELGNANLTGSISENSAVLEPDENSFIIKDEDGNNVAYIDSQGSVFLKGELKEYSELKYEGYKFEIRDENDNIIAFFDNKGSLDIKGEILKS